MFGAQIFDPGCEVLRGRADQLELWFVQRTLCLKCCVENALNTPRDLGQIGLTDHATTAL